MICIYFVVEFDVKVCFKLFVDEVSVVWLVVVRDFFKKILGECMKFVLNSVYGKIVEN